MGVFTGTYSTDTLGNSYCKLVMPVTAGPSTGGAWGARGAIIEGAATLWDQALSGLCSSSATGTSVLWRAETSGLSSLWIKRRSTVKVGKSD